MFREPLGKERAQLQSFSEGQRTMIALVQSTDRRDVTAIRSAIIKVEKKPMAISSGLVVRFMLTSPEDVACTVC